MRIPGQQVSKGKQTDWGVIERQYRAGLVSVRAIAETQGITEAAIRKRAKRDGWERDLTAQVKAQVRTALVRTSSRPVQKSEPARTEPRQDARTDQQIVDEAVATVVEVVRQHRAGARRGAKIVEQLFAELETTNERLEEIGEAIVEETVGDQSPNRRTAMLAAVKLPQRAGVLDKLASALQKFVAVERDAWSLNDKGQGDELANMSEEQLEARLAGLEAKLRGDA